MADKLNLAEVFTALKGRTSKQRQEALNNIRETFSRNEVVENFHKQRNNNGPPAWLIVFRNLFETVQLEKTAYINTKPSAKTLETARNRLAFAASTVRWLAERAAPYLNKNALKALVEHFLQTMVVKGELLAPVALDYIKGLKCLMAFRPHLEHVDDGLWMGMVEMAWNCILSDPIRTRFADGEDSMDIDGEGSNDDGDDDEAMFVDDDEEESGTSSARRNKRRRQGTGEPSPKKRKLSPVKGRRALSSPSTAEQLEFMALLSILLRPTSAPIMSPECPFLPSAILERFQRFLTTFPADSSLLRDYLIALLSTLSHLSLNHKHNVERFAKKAWNGLVGLWGTKNKRIKEYLVSILTILIPFVCLDDPDGASQHFDCVEGLGKLSNLLDREAETRWGAESLSLDSIRLELVASIADHEIVRIGLKSWTFCAGANFDAEQALAWAILELHADCIGKLFLLSESMQAVQSSSSSSSTKRSRFEDPVISLLQLIKTQMMSHRRAYHLQTLLFVIDRHWTFFHDSLKQTVVAELLQLVTLDDGTIQSWAFLCFAALASAESHKQHKDGAHRPEDSSSFAHDSTTWDAIWTHAIRRANVPTVCRFACHTAHTLLIHSQPLPSQYPLSLTSQKVLLEIETLVKDLDVQGPPYPYDSVCRFLAQALRTSSQDVRLYRMQLEDKVLTWLTDCWGATAIGRGQTAMHSITDILVLFENICSLTQHVPLVSTVALPESPVVETLLEQRKTAIIRNFLLYARLPDFQQAPEEVKKVTSPGVHTEARNARTLNVDLPLVSPSPRERKVSSFLLKNLEALLTQWETFRENNAHPNAEVARRALDFAVIAIVYECLLIHHGTQSNRRVMQLSIQLAVKVTSLLLDTRWTLVEKAFVIAGFDPVTRVDGEAREDWEALVTPGQMSGIRTETLLKLTGSRRDGKDDVEGRMQILRLIWQHPDALEGFTSLTTTIRQLLHSLVSETAFQSAGGLDADDKDGFGPIRTTATQQSAEVDQTTSNAPFIQSIATTCVAFLSLGPVMQSDSGEATRDNDLTELLLRCADSEPEMFLQIFPIVLQSIRHRTLRFGVTNYENLLGELLNFQQYYSYGKNESFHLLCVQFLDSTMDVWLSKPVVSTSAGAEARTLCRWYSQALKTNKLRSWTVRDAFVRFLDRYLTIDPREEVLSIIDDAEKEEAINSTRPTETLPGIGADPDLRVRFRGAVIHAHLFSATSAGLKTPLVLYQTLKDNYTTELDQAHYEHLLTRLLALGNIMIVSSAVRRGSYWHLLEICIHTSTYIPYVKAIIAGVSQRMGLSSRTGLFEAYASQLAFSIRKAGSDILQFPPNILGYKSRKECAAASFQAFTPTNILTDASNLFQSHCRALRKSPEEGIRECFGEIVGYHVVTGIHDGNEDNLELHLKSIIGVDDAQFDKLLQENVDAITTSILFALGDQDFGAKGPIAEALPEKRKRIFCAINQHRLRHSFEPHEPNLPAFPTPSVLRSLDWLTHRVPTPDAKSILYHVLHQLFAAIHKTPLLNEQDRLLNALSLFVSYSYRHFDDATLLRTLLHGATSLLAQSDLARAAQSILEWVFYLYKKNLSRDFRISDILIKIASVAHLHAHSIDSSVRAMGSDLQRWVDKQTLDLAQLPHTRSQVARALPAWPHQPSDELQQLFDSIGPEKLSPILGDHRISTNKFRLVRRLRDYALTEAYDPARFSETDFWRLKDCMPPVDQLQDDDIDAFATLLLESRGQLQSFGSEHPNPNSVREIHRNAKAKKDDNITSGPRDAIISRLLGMLEETSHTQVQIAYSTLRLVTSVTGGHILQGLGTLSTEQREELQRLHAYPRVPKVPAGRVISELDSDTHTVALEDYPHWIGLVTTLFADILSKHDPFFAQLGSILREDVIFAEEILPILVHTLLVLEKQDPATDAPVRTHISRYFSAVLSSLSASTSAPRAIIDVVLHLRYFVNTDRDGKLHDALGYDKWLDLDYVLLAQKAIVCGAYTTALLFLELATEYQSNGGKSGDAAETILYEIYSHIDEPDGFYGIKTQNIQRFLLKRFHHESKWEKAFRFHGAALEAGSGQEAHSTGLVKAYHSFGFDHLAMTTVQNWSAIGAGVPSSSDLSYRLGWRTETWDLPDREERSSGTSLYLALRAVHRERDLFVVDAVVKRVLYEEMGRLRSLGSENIAEIREVAMDLMCLTQISRWRNDDTQKQLNARRIKINEWRNFTDIDSDFQFSDLENIMATRISLLRSARQKEERNQIGEMVSPFMRDLVDIEKKCLVRLSSAARDARQIQVALNSITRAQGLEHSPTLDVSDELAGVLWIQKEEKVAVQFLRELVLPEKPPTEPLAIGPLQKALLLSKLGSWTAEACLEKPTDIWAHFFEPSIALVNMKSDSDDDASPTARASIFHECAMFAERQYNTMLRSPDVLRLKLYVDLKTKEIASRDQEMAKELNPRTKSTLRNYQDKANKLLRQDTEQLRTHKVAREAFLQEAIDMHSRSLETSDKFDHDAPTRLCSLWFANFEEAGVQDKVRIALDRVPSRKLVFLAHQLSARLSKPQGSQLIKNQETLKSLIVRMCKEHPFHSLYQVYCLQADQSPVPSQTTSLRRQSSIISSANQTARSLAAQEVFDALRSDPKHTARVQDIDLLCRACLQWAKHPIKDLPQFKHPKRPGEAHKIPSGALIRTISNLRIPVMTVHTPIDPTTRYENCVWIDRYEPTFETAGGINLPKINVCHGSDGQKYKQLFKGEGNDDLRQDAVMEQVFDLVNSVLTRDRETRRRGLSVRDYKVIPLGAQAGLLEFVGNTSPLQSWLSRAHPLYHPKDLKVRDVRTALEKIHREYQGQRPKLAEHFLLLRNQFKPVMRHYFTEKHKSPISWFAMRLNYTRSVATTSIVGHILGLGDRHVSNILLDNGTGAVVHIDLGIAFDQGKLLPVPECVPFRMTADMVDGMGTSGTQGVFHRCAEETLRVLRHGSEIIMTVLEVFKYDPLHSWTASEVKVKRIQGQESKEVTDTITGAGAGAPPTALTAHDTARFGAGIGIDMSSGTAEEAADRALSGVARKLDKALSVEYTVNALIAEATDPLNLASLYVGWSPYY